MSQFDDMTNKQLMELEQQFYDPAAEGHDEWFYRDQVLWEMNRRGLMDRYSKSE